MMSLHGRMSPRRGSGETTSPSPHRLTVRRGSAMAIIHSPEYTEETPKLPAFFDSSRRASSFREGRRDRSGSASKRNNQKMRRTSTVTTHHPPNCLGHLSSVQINLVRKSWKHINSRGIHQVFTRLFHKLESRSPVVADAFKSGTFLAVKPTQSQVVTVSDHAKFMTSFFNDLIENLETSEKLQTTIQSYGCKHAPLIERCKFKPDTWEKFGEIATETITNLEGIKTNKETSRSWRILIACLTDEMRFGYEQIYRQYNRRPSNPDVSKEGIDLQQLEISDFRQRTHSGARGASADGRSGVRYSLPTSDPEMRTCLTPRW